MSRSIWRRRDFLRRSTRSLRSAPFGIATALDVAAKVKHRAVDDARVCAEVFLVLESREPSASTEESLLSTHPTDRSMKCAADSVSAGDSVALTLTLHREGLNMSEIATTRTLAVGTIERHMEILIARGDVQVESLLTPEILARGSAIWKTVGMNARLKVAHAAASGALGYAELRFCRAAMDIQV